MHKTFIFVFLLFSLSGAALAGQATETQYLAQLRDFHAGLQKRSLLLRHQVEKIIADFEAADGQERLNALDANKSAFEYLARNADTFNVSADSKKFIKQTANKLAGINTLIFDRKTVEPAAPAEIPAQVEEAPATALAIPAPAVFASGEVALARDSSLLKRVFIPSMGVRSAASATGVKGVDGAAIAEASTLPWKDIGLGLFVISLALGAGITAGVRGTRGLLSSWDKARRKLAGKEAAVSLKLLNASFLPVVCINEKERVVWANRKAVADLGLTPGSSFYKKQELTVEDGKSSYLDEDTGHKFLVESKNVRIKGKKRDMIFFYPLSEVLPGKSYYRARGSKPLSGALENALIAHNYLFSSSRIPLVVEEEGDTCSLSSSEEGMISDIVALSYHMAKDVENSKVAFKLTRRGARQNIEIRIRNLSDKRFDFSQTVGLDRFRSGPLEDMWAEIEAGLCQRDGRVLMAQEREGTRPVFVLEIGFNAGLTAEIPTDLRRGWRPSSPPTV